LKTIEINDIVISQLLFPEHRYKLGAGILISSLFMVRLKAYEKKNKKFWEVLLSFDDTDRIENKRNKGNTQRAKQTEKINMQAAK
jgi:hypothetical protein